MASSETILIVEDDPAILLGLQKNLKFEGYRVLSAADGDRGLSKAIDESPDLILLDIMLPGIDGYAILKTLRSNGIETPVIALTAKDRLDDKIAGLDLGADDYITKPFSIRELTSRIQAVLRRAKKAESRSAKIAFADVEIDFEAHSVRKAGREVSMTHTELRLLQFLLENPNRALARNDILNRVWGHDYYGTSRTIDNFVNRLRSVLEDDPKNPRHFLTVRGTGYKFVGDEAP